MSGLMKTVRRAANASIGKGYKTSGERKLARADRVQSAKDEMFAGAALPDEEEIKRNARRKASIRRGSRAETVLTDQLG